MASSQIQIPSSSPTFRCILRERDKYKESGNGRLSLQKNIQDFVRDLQACSSSRTISISDDKYETSSCPHPITTPSGLRMINAGRSPSPENKLEQRPKPSSLPRSAGNSPNIGGASTLVQMWEARLNRSHSFNHNMINSTSSSRTNSGLSITTKESDIEIDNQSELSHQTAEAESPQQNASEASEGEPVRVADIIKRLTNTCIGGQDGIHNNDQDQSREPSPDSNPSTSLPCTLKITADKVENASNSSPRIRPVAPQQHNSETRSPRVAGEGRVDFPKMSNLPRLRGRQAIQDLLMRIESDKQSEIRSLVDRKAVSTFPHKGRIQSMLRLKIFQRGLTSHHPVPSPPTRPKLISCSIANRRLRFDPEAEPQPSSNPRKARGFHEEDSVPSEIGPSTHSLMSHELNASKSACEVGSCSKSGQPFIDSLCQDAKTLNAILPSAIDEQNVVVPPVHQLNSDASEEMHEVGSLNSFVTWRDQSSETNEGNCLSMMSSEEADANSQQYVVENGYYDWFSDISRPRRYWEDRRRQWYQQVLETASEDTEIRQLLERKTVSSFLDSSFRLKMDQLMMTRLSNRASPGGEEFESEERSEHVMMRFFQRQLGPSNQQPQEETHEQVQERENVEQVQEEEEEEQDDIEDGNLTGSEYNEVTSYFEQNPVSPQLPLPSSMSSGRWSGFREPELSEESEQAGLNRQQRSPFLHANIGTSLTPPTNPTTLEMELIYYLKGHLEQLYQEMTELRKSISCCMDMQAKLQLSFKQQIHSECVESAPNGTVGPLKKGSCCICYEAPVDSLLYRCGHMCTCINCAQELQWSSGKCPICRAPIVDVVRAYTDFLYQ
uniref:RING-type domain-containing protein n=1 Tax=Kalanchoe fedtschenkoi TaxID=63787 RepID=A0A7N0T7B5_KALFE